MKKTLYVIAGLVGITLIALIGFGYMGRDKSRFAGPTSVKNDIVDILH